MTTSTVAASPARTMPSTTFVPTLSGRSARLVSANRPNVPIYALSPGRETVRRCGLMWGVRAASMRRHEVTEELVLDSVRRVEEQIGLRLFERVPQGVRATQAGERFLERAQMLRRDFDDAMAEMHSLRTGEQGVVRIGYSLTFSSDLLHQVCKRLLRERPAAKLKLSCRMAHQLIGALNAGELDIVFAPIRSATPELNIQPLYRDRLVIAADAAHPICQRQNLRLQDLAQVEWALPAGHITVRRMLDDGGWVRTFMDEAESQRTHLMAFVALAKPNAWERFLIVLVQGIFYNAYFFLYLISAGTAHRLAAYFAEQAVQGYSKYLSQIESGERAMQPAPALAIAYWALAPDAQVRDMIASMLEDEAIHRDLHHAFADALMQGQTFPDRISSIS